MHALTILSALLATAAALPKLTERASNWVPAPNSTVTCTQSDKVISFVVGPQEETVLNDACAEMMPPCAYSERLNDTNIACSQTISWELRGPKTSTQNANVEMQENGNKLSGWAVKFSVTPPKTDPPNQIMWSKYDCYGYFAQIVEPMAPQGCHNSMASGIGSIKVGGGSLAGTIFNIDIVKGEADLSI
ncbi:uncharacterized protein BDR25DRAFT_310863 [Lindgomyces ingoldianus]|uniref:Uncharacterized protein n=1 Tax=Lindgomyces ingoldianus TaxID=673940 RepID=A0ACB6RAY1_9PLEO|nr:uncharacterized protein BDR25DRAFT_310863 [Lindgomyces ingoldianus]KAF2475505.1 hypothetical protein BDR25DRAFT_310863 [Lindgomyces ingoldianus]